jgi:small-conductance mechanosensitive channel
MDHVFQVATATLGGLLSGVPGWVIGLMVMAASAAVALLLTRTVINLLYRLAGRISPFLQSLLARSRGVAGALLVLAALAGALPSAGLGDRATQAVLEALVVGLILVVAWGSVIALDLACTVYLKRYRTDVEDNLLARKHVTQVAILRRAADLLIGLVAVSAALMTFPAVRQYGVSLFASAGAAGLIVGLAARPVLSNLIAGIQIAVTQPIRLEDAVVVQGEWGWVEKIASTYVVLRLWDWRRLIVPISWFVENSFQNWTHETASLIGTVLLRVDYTVPVDRVRAKLTEIAQGSALWDGHVVNLQVTDASDTTVELRALVSARNSPQTWDLRCEVREKLIAWLQAEYPDALPKRRTEFDRLRRAA